MSGNISPPSMITGVTKMNSKRTVFAATVTLAGIALSLALAGCGPQSGTPAAASNPAVHGTADRTATLTAASTKHESPRLKTFTFPDGHITFAYPDTWTVRDRPPSGRPARR